MTLQAVLALTKSLRQARNIRDAVDPDEILFR